MTLGRQSDHLASLSERERETLRLLVAGHDAKSVARSLSLSVHTVNERLRDARRKLGVSSSREAARLLAEAEGSGPNFLGDRQLGVAQAAPDLRSDGRSIMRRSGGHPLAWLGGGMLIMSIIVAAVAATAIFVSTSASQGAGGGAAPAASLPATAETAQARDWLALLDRQRWDESWDVAGSAFHTLPKPQWASTAVAVRQPLGAVSSRVLQTVTRTTNPPGAPAGEYQLIEFRTTFAQKPDAVERVVLMREPAGWRVNGYFIR